MPEPREAIAQLMDQAASGPIADPDLDHLVRRGVVKKQRRNLGQISAVMVLVAAIVVGIGVGTQKNGSSHSAPAGFPTTSRPAGPSVSQLTHGVWNNVPAPPNAKCAANSVATVWDGNALVLLATEHGCRTPMAYDPRTDTWRVEPALPSSIQAGVLATGSANGLVVADEHGNVAILKPGAWQSLPSLVTTENFLQLFEFDGHAVAFGLGASGAGVDELQGSVWHPLPSVPLPTPHALPGWALSKVTVDGISTVTIGHALYALVHTDWTQSRTQGGGRETRFGEATMLLELGDHSWRSVRAMARLGISPTSLNTAGSALLAVGSQCTGGESCPPSLGPAMERLTLGARGVRASEIGIPPGTDDGFSATAVPNAVIAFYWSVGQGTHFVTPPGTSQIYDPKSGRWLAGPNGSSMQEWQSQTWTPYGLVVLGDPVEKCLCSLGGLMLVPAKR